MQNVECRMQMEYQDWIGGGATRRVVERRAPREREKMSVLVATPWCSPLFAIDIWL